MSDETVRAGRSEGVSLLLEAIEYAEELGLDRWDFAVELPSLRRAGMSNNDVRRLIFAGYAENARVISRVGEPREFRRDKCLVISKRTCLVLTDAGVAWARALPVDDVASDEFHTGDEAEDSSATRRTSSMHETCDAARFEPSAPTWDRNRQELRWGELVVKQFKVPSINQQTVLSVFQEENWPTRIDDPLPPSEDIDPKRRLNDTIKSLNRNQKSRRVRFMGDGTGRGVRWEPILASESSVAAQETGRD